MTRLLWRVQVAKSRLKRNQTISPRHKLVPLLLALGVATARTIIVVVPSSLLLVRSIGLSERNDILCFFRSGSLLLLLLFFLLAAVC
jgi:hypothetical protein